MGTTKTVRIKELNNKKLSIEKITLIIKIEQIKIKSHRLTLSNKIRFIWKYGGRKD